MITPTQSLTLVWFLSLGGCKSTPPEGSVPLPHASSSTSAAKGAPSVGPGCEAAAKKLTECQITAAAAGLEPCDERVGACIAGQGCEAIRTRQTGCVFE